MIRKGIDLDKSQSCCGSRYAKCLHQGETKNLIAICVKIIASHCTNSGFNYAFHASTYKNTVTDMLLDVCKRNPSDDGSSCIATDILYTTLDNCYAVYKEMGPLQHGRIRLDWGPQHCGIDKPRLDNDEW
eukprot:8938954-Ditylum_brightwellii.AAC.2